MSRISFLRTTNYELRTNAGFTLIELVVVMGIIVVVSAVTLANNTRFGGSVLLQNLAYDIALSIRQAQVYGISVRNYSAGNFSAGYGMHFDIVSPTSYVLFADAVDANGRYDGTMACPQSGGSGREFILCNSIGRGYRIDGLCSPAGAVPLSCTRVDQLDVVFRRPEPDARITAGSGGQKGKKKPTPCK